MIGMMTEIEFEQQLSLFGADISAWPAESRTAAEAFAQTNQGKKLLEAEKQLDSLFSVSLAMGHEHIEDRNLEAFLKRLEAVPHSYVQEKPLQNKWFSGLQAFLASFDIEVSSAALASQMAALFVALGVGIMVGFNSEGGVPSGNDVGTTEIDISETWFSDINDIEQDAELAGE